MAILKLGHSQTHLEHIGDQTRVDGLIILNERQQNTLSLVNAIQEAALVCDPDSGQVLSSNSTAAYLLGYKSEEFDQLNVEDLFSTSWAVLLAASRDASPQYIAARKKKRRFLSGVYLL